MSMKLDRIIEEMETVPSRDILVQMKVLGRKIFVNTSKDDLINTIRQEFAEDENYPTNLRVRFDKKAQRAILEESHVGRPYKLTQVRPSTTPRRKRLFSAGS